MVRVVNDPALGRFEWDEEFGSWRGSLVLPSGRVADLDISPATDDHSDRPDTPEVFAAAYPVAEQKHKNHKNGTCRICKILHVPFCVFEATKSARQCKPRQRGVDTNTAWDRYKRNWRSPARRN
jgi:hypothetical protein